MGHHKYYLAVFSAKQLVVGSPDITPVEDGHRPKMLSVFVRGTEEAMAEASPCDEPAKASGACAFGIDALPPELVHLIVSYLSLSQHRTAPRRAPHREL